MSTREIKYTALYLTFKLDQEMFAIDVAQVREILDLAPITKMPQAPDYMRGVINVRGSVVPVVDMRRKFGLADAQSTVNTRIIVMELTQAEETMVIGAMADSVHDVVEMEPDQIEDPPRIGTRWRTELIKGIGKQEGQFTILLDIDRIFSTDELVLVDSSATEVEVKQAA